MLSLVCLLLCAPDPELVDVTALRDALAFAHDGKGHYIAWNIEHTKLFYGDGKTFFETGVLGYGSDDEKSEFHFVDNRYKRGDSKDVVIEKGTPRVVCADRVTTLSVVSADDTARLRATAVFKRMPFAHSPYALARDEAGVYYLVDQGRFADNEKLFRVFVGTRGAMKPLKLKNVVHDSEGDIFSTPKGDLRLVLSRAEAKWVAGKKNVPLLAVDVRDNLQMIYNELGPYVGVRLGTPCDDL
jgi:hypothetical protein